MWTEGRSWLTTCIPEHHHVMVQAHHILCDLHGVFYYLQAYGITGWLWN